MKTSIALLIWILPVIANAQGQPSLVSVAFNPATVTGGTSSTATITISAPARNNGFEVTLSLNSTVARVTSSTITIAEGQTSQTVSVATSPVATPQVVILTASTRAETRSGSITISPPAISGIAITPSTINSGDQARATITLTGNAPSDGFPVSLSSSAGWAMAVPPLVRVRSNERSLDLVLVAQSVTTGATVTLTAAAAGVSKTTTLAVGPVLPSISVLKLGPDIPSGTQVARTIALSTPALAGGTIVQLSATGADILQARGNAVADTIREGQLSVAKSNVAPLTDTDRPFEVTATLNGSSKRMSGTLRAPTILSLSIADSVFEGTTTTLRANLRGVPPASGLPVVITSDNQSAITSPGAVSGTYEAGRMSYSIRANDVSTRTPVSLSVEREGVVQRVSTTVIPRVILLTGFTVTPSSVRGGQSVTITATINGPAPRGGTVVQLVEFPGLTGFDVPTTLLIPEGATGNAVTVAAPRFALPLWTDVKASLDTRSLDRMRFSVRVTVNP